MALGRNRSDAPRRNRGPTRRPSAIRAFAGSGGRLAAAAATAAAIATTAVTVPGPAQAAASIASEQAKANQLTQQIVADGAAVQQAVAEEDTAQARSADLAAQVAATTARLATYRQDQARAGRTLQRLLIQSYTSDQGAAGVSAVFQGSSASTLMTQAEYSHVADGNLQVAIAAYRTDEQQTHAAAATLEAQQAQASAAAAQLASAAQQAQAALAQDTALLNQVKGNLAALQAAAAAQAKKVAQQEAALAAQEAQRRLAPPPPAAQVTSTPAPTPSTPRLQAAAPPAAAPGPVTAPSGYANPLRAISGLAPERIDQGVDYQGYGPLYAIGTGVVLNTVNGGWPGGTFITYRLTSGPAAGLVVYAAEDIQPAVQVGQQVTPTTVIGTMYEGPDGIETGWADPAGTGYTMAYDSGQFAGSNSTAFGANFSQLLAALGAPGGILQNNPPAGTLPGTWPSW